MKQIHVNIRSLKFLLLLSFVVNCNCIKSEELTRADSLFHQSIKALKNENHSEAKKLCEQALTLYNIEVGENSLKYASALNTLGKIYSRAGNYQKAQSSYEKSRKIFQQLVGTKNKYYLTVTQNLAYSYKLSDDFPRAESLYIETMNLIRDFYGETDKTYIICLYNLAALYVSSERFEQAERLLLQAANIQATTYGTKNEDYAIIIDNLGVLYLSMGEFKKSEPLLLESLSIREKLYGTSHSQYSGSLNNLATFYSETGDQKRALQIYNQSLAIKERLYGKFSLPYALTLCNIAGIYYKVNKLEDSERVYNECLSIRKAISDSLDLNVALNNHNLAMVYHKKRDYDLSEQYYNKALQIYEKKLGRNSLSYATTLAGKALLFKNTQRPLDAETMYNEVLTTTDNIIGKNNTKYLTHLGNLTNLLFWIDEYQKAEPLLKEHYRINKNITKQNFSFMSEYQREKYLAILNQDINTLYPRFCYYDYSRNDSISCLAYDNELFKKGLLLNTLNEIKLSIFESGDSALISKWHQLQYIKELIMKLQSMPREKQHDIANLEKSAETLDKELTARSTAYHEANANMNILWSDVQQNLKDNDAAVEFVSFQDSTDITYYALLLRKGYKYPKLIPLCSEGEISKSFDPADEKRAAYTYSDTNNLYDKLWGKLATYIEDGAKVYYSPSGMLHLINLEAIPVDQNTYLGDKYKMTRLSSTREIVMGSKQTADKTAALYGGIKYNLSANDMALESKRYASEEHIMATRSIEYESDSLYRGDVRELPGTKVEAEAIKKLLSPKFSKVTTFYADSANEESFKALSGKKYNILHIGTHGFFWPIEKASRQNLFKGRMTEPDNEDASKYNPLADPLQRSGLLFAGAGLALSGKADSLIQNVEDGVLTAKEISNLDLRGADLAVLSACKTGLGEVSGEGVFGLQRGFKQAGVKTIIMSLWKVNDITTKDFMLNFYKHLTNGAHKRDAFNSAVHETRKKYPEPEYWAAFVMVD